MRLARALLLFGHRHPSFPVFGRVAFLGVECREGQFGALLLFGPGGQQPDAPVPLAGTVQSFPAPRPEPLAEAPGYSDRPLA